jgi:predicted CopG family antitoxin
VKTIAVDETTWKKIKMLKDKLDARSYDEVLQKLIETWHLVELDKKVENIVVDEDEEEILLKVLEERDKK